jgi:hypothetical protein
VQTNNKTTLMLIGKWMLLAVGLLGCFFSFVAWFLVPGAVDRNRLVVAGLFASLATNSFFLSGMLFRESAGDGLHKVKSVFLTPPLIISGVFLLAFLLVAATAPWWASR